MIKNFLFALALLLLIPSISVSASNHNPHNMHDLIALGLATNLGLKVKSLDVVMGTEEIKIEESIFDSTIFATSGYDRSLTLTGSSMGSIESDKFSGQVGVRKRFKSGLESSLSLSSEWVNDNDSSNELDPRYRTALFLDVTQPLLQNLGKAVNTTRLQVARNQQQQVALGHLLQAQNLIMQLETVTRQLGAKTQIIQLQNTALDLADELYRANKKKFKAGIIPVTEVQEAETARAARQLNLSLAVQDRNLVQEELNRQLNHRLVSNFNPDDLVDFEQPVKTINLPEFDQLLEQALLKRLELKISDYAVQNISLQHDYLNNQMKPRLDLKFQAGINGLSGAERNSTINNQYSGDWLNSFGSMGDADGYQWRAGLEFSMPLGNRAAKSRYRQSELQLKQERYQQKDIRVVIKNDLLQQLVNVSSTREQLEISERFEALAEKSFNQEQKRLNEGLSDTFRMIMFQQKMVAAKIDRINAITRYNLAQAQMEFARGNIFERHNIILTNNIEELHLENI